MGHPVSTLRYAAAALAALGLVQASATAAPQSTANPTFGPWTERDMKLEFDVRPGANPKEVVLVIPKDVIFPGSHQFTLAKRSEGLFEANDPGRPKVVLSFQSASQAKLEVRGYGPNWISMNDFILVRR